MASHVPGNGQSGLRDGCPVRDYRGQVGEFGTSDRHPRRGTGHLETDEICARLDAEEVPYAKINQLDEVHNDPQILHRGSIVEVDHPFAGTMRMPTPPARFQSTPSNIRFLAPMLGQHTDEVLTEIGHTPDKIAAYHAAGIVD